MRWKPIGWIRGLAGGVVMVKHLAVSSAEGPKATSMSSYHLLWITTILNEQEATSESG